MAWRQSEPYAPSPHLPPRELWRFVPGEDERQPTPVDERGLVDVKRLISLVKSTVEPEFTWQSIKDPNEHHLFWGRSRYPNIDGSSVNPHEFRNLDIHKIVVPRMFHEWLHLVTDEPPVPGEETMHYRIMAQKVVLSLFRTARQSKQLTRKRYITDERLERGLQIHFEEFNTLLEEAETTIPPEFQPCDLSHLHPERAVDLHTIVPVLGRLALTRVHVRDVVEPLAA